MRRRHRNLDFAGSVHFVTTVARERGNWFVEESTCTQILAVFEHYRERYSLDCFGYVLMPDHLHSLLLQKEDGSFVSSFMNSFKRETSKQLRIPGFHAPSLWNDRYDDVPVPNREAVLTRFEYMHGNPIRRNLVSSVEEYKWSSARFYHDASDHGVVTVVRP